MMLCCHRASAPEGRGLGTRLPRMPSAVVHPYRAVERRAGAACPALQVCGARGAGPGAACSWPAASSAWSVAGVARGGGAGASVLPWLGLGLVPPACAGTGPRASPKWCAFSPSRWRQDPPGRYRWKRTAGVPPASARSEVARGLMRCRPACVSHTRRGSGAAARTSPTLPGVSPVCVGGGAVCPKGVPPGRAPWTQRGPVRAGRGAQRGRTRAWRRPPTASTPASLRLLAAPDVGFATKKALATQ
jgi:hypothetical protein